MENKWRLAEVAWFSTFSPEKIISEILPLLEFHKISQQYLKSQDISNHAQICQELQCQQYFNIYNLNISNQIIPK